ncbi:MAG: DUF2892 domain-containing protein [Chitinivibrionia bacterium]|nr:DUF2892 domain-containing protein [Chitinivibrionia bacterium]
MKIEKNEGSSDRIIRTFIVLALFVVAIFFVEGRAKVFCIIMGIVMTATTAMGFCPLYLIFGVNTCGKRK